MLLSWCPTAARQGRESLEQLTGTLTYKVENGRAQSGCRARRMTLLALHVDRTELPRKTYVQHGTRAGHAYSDASRYDNRRATALVPEYGFTALRLYGVCSLRSGTLLS